MGRLRTLVLLAAGAIIIGGLWSFRWEPASLVVIEETLSVPWPAATGPRIAVLADLHVGSPFNDLDRLRDVVRRTNAAGPDPGDQNRDDGTSIVKPHDVGVCCRRP